MKATYCNEHTVRVNIPVCYGSTVSMHRRNRIESIAGTVLRSTVQLSKVYCIYLRVTVLVVNLRERRFLMNQSIVGMKELGRAKNERAL